MPKVTITFEDVPDSETVRSSIGMEAQGADPNGPATQAMLMALTVRKMLVSGLLERMVQFFCQPELAEIALMKGDAEPQEPETAQPLAVGVSVAPVSAVSGYLP